MTISDHKLADANKKWLYTAVTRATDLANVYFVYDYYRAKGARRRSSTFGARSRGIAKKTRRQRAVNEANYIKTEWLLGCLGKPCGSCGDCLAFSKPHGEVE